MKMKRKSLLIMLLMALLVPLAMNGQNRATLTVYGDNTTTNEYVPIYGYWADSKSKCEFIIPKEKIVAMNGGSISAMKFYLSSSSTSNQISATFDVFVKEVSATTLTGYTGSSDATTVFSNTITIATGASNVEFDIPFTSNYVYNGGNLLVGFYQTGNTSYNHTYWVGESQSTNTAWSGYGSQTGSGQKFLPKTTFTYVASSNPYITLNPSSATVLAGSTQTLTATYGNVTNPTITYSSSNNSVATVTGNGTTATVTGITSGSATITATMNGTYTATCAVTVADLSDCEGFETGLGFWTVTAENSSYTWARTTGTGNSSYSSAGEGSYNVGAYYSSNLGAYTYLTLNADLSSFTDKTISFKYINPSWSGDTDYIYLQYTTDGTTYTNLASYTSGASSWTQITALAIPDEAKYIRFAALSKYGYGVGLDEICLDYSASSCAKPTGLTLSGIATHGVTATWDAEAGDVFQYAMVAGANISPSTVTTFDGSITATGTTCSMSWNNLLADTDYTLVIRKNCGNDDYSTAVAQSFTTLESCLKPTNVTASDVTINSAHISWDGNAESYNVQYATATVNGTTLEPVFEDSFENGLDNWTIYIEGYQSTETNDFNITDWHLMESNSSASPHTGNYMAMSRSYDGTDRTVDNWLVSPQMTLGDVLTFWVIDDGTWHEHLEVWVSTGTNAISDFVKVATPGDATSSWTMKTVDLSAYAGQQGYVAIRHNDTGKDWIFVDDFGVYTTVNTYSYGTFTTLPSTSQNSCDITGLSPETLYVAQVQSDCGDPDGTSGWSSVYFTTPDACSAPTELVTSNITATTATLGWSDNQDSYNVQYREMYFYEGFESATLPTGWTTIDNNGDGNTWSIGFATSHSGDNGAYNLSYVYSSDGSVTTTPDDYLVSPQLDLQGTLRVWLSGYARSSSNYSEHFEILLSTTGNSVSDFNTTLVGETTTTDAYVEYTADLSSYAGQQGYIAIHHFNCTDQYYLYVDDFGLYGTENWVSVNPNPTDATTTLTGLQPNTGYEWQVQGINCDGNGGTTEWSAVATFTTPEIPAVPVESITASDINLLIGATATITPTVLPADATNPVVTYTSADATIATVDANGLVTGIAAGNTTITIAATDGSGVSTTINVTVTGIDVTGITADDITVVNGETATISYTVAPADASDPSVTFTSADATIATVDAEGVVTGVAVGTTTITIASVSNPEVTATINVTVTPDPNAVQFTLVAPAAAQPGDVITVEAYMAAPTSGNYDGFTGLVLGIQFDTDAFEVYGNPTAGPVAAASQIAMAGLPNDNHPDLVQYSLVMVPGNPNTTTGLVFSAQFTVLQDVELGSYTFTPEVTNGAANFIINMSNNPIPIPYEVTPSEVVIGNQYTKQIAAYDGNGGYYLIASPIGQVSPENVTNMLENDYDLYYFDQEQELEWINYKDQNDGGYNLEPGKGYLYANSQDVDLIFTGIAYTNGDVTLDLKGTDGWAGWNLVGNPFAEDAYLPADRSFYTMQNSNVFTATSGEAIHAMEGVFVIAANDGETLTFSTTAPTNTGSKLNLNVSKDNNFMDRAIVRFGQGNGLPKIQFRKGSTKVYMPVEGNDYAVAYTENEGEMPVSFKAEKNGTYTLSFTAEEVSFAYLHLIDNLTGNDVDLLANPSYTFDAATTDYAQRFRLVFATGDNDNFAFFSNGSFIITNDGEATLQVVDVMGRIISSETINGNANVNVNAAAGVYMLRLVNGDNVKVQKVVVR